MSCIIEIKTMFPLRKTFLGDSITMQDINRKLIAILSADVKDYSRLMGEDKVSTLKTLLAYFQIITRIVQRHRGRVVPASLS